MTSHRKSKSKTPVKIKDPHYSPSEMVERHYEPHRNGGMMSGERTDIMSLAVAYKLDKTGLKALADYMNAMDGKVRHVPPKAGDIAKEHAIAKPMLTGGRDRKPHVFSFKDTEKEVLGPSY